MAKGHKGWFGVEDPVFIQAGCDTDVNTLVALREVPIYGKIHGSAFLGREITPDIQELMLGKMVIGFLVKNRDAMKSPDSIKNTLASFDPYKGTYSFEWKAWQNKAKYNGFHQNERPR